MSFADVSVIIGFLGVLGGVIRYELESKRHALERKEQLELLKVQNQLVQEIRDSLVIKG